MELPHAVLCGRSEKATNKFCAVGEFDMDSRVGVEVGRQESGDIVSIIVGFIIQGVREHNNIFVGG